MDRFKQLLLQTFKSFKALCEAHDIKFMAAGGTMLGAVRHGSMIPWDDDIDVYMLREEYDKFMALKDQIRDTDYEIIDPTVPGYYCAMAKYSYRKTSILEMQDIPFLMGVYIDVFVLDYETGSYEEIVKKRMRFTKMADMYCLSAIQRPWKRVLSQFFKGNIAKGIRQVAQKIVIRPMRPYFNREVLHFPKSSKGEWFVAYTGVLLQKDVLKAEWFDQTITKPFEDTTIEVPAAYDAFLTHMYGDYMQLPPIEKRVSHHPHPYLNLDRRVPIDVAMNAANNS